MSIKPADIPVVILAGGRGTRLMEETQIIPKPMVTVGGKPILWHIMMSYSHFGFRKFVVCLGYKGFVIKEYFMNLLKHTSSVKIKSKSGEYAYEADRTPDWEIALVETGENSLTGTRVKMVASYIDAPHFCLTYGDGVCDIPLDREWDFHLSHDKLGTVAAVHPPSRFGMIEIANDNQVNSFQEKEPLHHDFINGGYFMFRRDFLGRLPADGNYSLESDPLTRLARDGQLAAFKHAGYWQCMDTIRDRENLEKIYDSGKAPWVRW
ncbi:MAG TPA: sugar phosphate nucleotidyltransferase [Kiritimatiellia bacterium]|nr:sugar phosphate nucleotidyltransferase [Kiritimatiellia bacterium]HMO98674.1 sugar phosphate nucleotidyltransferase [Kiritimatiellia bacterium]HMP90832.1 sugar phosphate nucleotidyltransferase [Kiritimatiellia bacterium]